VLVTSFFLQRAQTLLTMLQLYELLASPFFPCCLDPDTAAEA